MTHAGFDTPVEDLGDVLVGPWRTPHQMLAAQSYDDHASIHDEATAQKLGFKAATIEGPTHFSQFAPLGAELWGERWFVSGCISAHYRNAVFEGERVRAFLAKPANDAMITDIWMHKEDGTEVLRGTASVGAIATTALAERLATLPALEKPVILRDVKVGMKTDRRPVRMGFDQNMGAMYPFTLNDKLKVITEPSPFYTVGGAANTSWKRAIIPMEMVSVLIGSADEGAAFPARGPAVGLFADQEIRLVKGPIFVDEPYEIVQEVVGLSGSRRTESIWVRTTVFEQGASWPAAVMLLNNAILKNSYATYEAELAAL